MNLIIFKAKFKTSIHNVFTFVIAQDTDVYVTRFLNSLGDHLELKKVFNPGEGGLNLHQSPGEVDNEVIVNGHCSAMVKVYCFDLPIMRVLNLLTPLVSYEYSYLAQNKASCASFQMLSSKSFAIFDIRAL